jgi:hypothetical protein
MVLETIEVGQTYLASKTRSYMQLSTLQHYPPEAAIP